MDIKLIYDTKFTYHSKKKKANQRIMTKTSFVLNSDSKYQIDSEGSKLLRKEILKHIKYLDWQPYAELKHHYAFQSPAPFKHIDKGFFGDPTFSRLLTSSKVKFKRLTPSFGLEVIGLQLSTLTDVQKNDLALLVETYGTVIFRQQDFKNLPIEEAIEWHEYYGPLHIHAANYAAKSYPEVTVLLRHIDEDDHSKTFADKLNVVRFHSDGAYEIQPPGLTLFGILQTGAVDNGDTQFIDTIEAYERLSPVMKNLIDDLKVVSSSFDEEALWDGIKRKKSNENIHPLVRFHPVLKKKALFVNNIFSRRVLGLKREESDFLLRFLISHIERCLDAHVRIRWDENSIGLWDNRRVVHAATHDSTIGTIRHAFRLSAQAERPVSSEKDYKEWTTEKEVEALQHLEYILSCDPGKYFEIQH